MPQGLQTLVALLILLPGFVSARLARSLSAQVQQSELERIIEALIFSFFNYVIYIACFGISLTIEWVPSFQVHRWRILFLALMACGVGLFWGVVRSRDWLLGLLRRWKLTERTGGESVWNDVFFNLEGSVQAGLKDGRNLVGWIGRYSDSGGERSLFIEKARWVAGENSTVEIPGKGILLTDKSEIEYVMFLDEDLSHADSKGNSPTTADLHRPT